MPPDPGVRRGLVRRAGRLWSSRRAGPALRTVAGFASLYAAIEVLLRNRVPPAGELVFGALIGVLYALVAFGLILIHRANRIINFAQAEMGAASAVLAVLLIKVDHWPYLAGLLVAIVSAAVAGAVVELLVVRRFGDAPRLVLSVATIGLTLLFAVVQFYLPKLLGGRYVSPTPPRTPFSGVHLTIAPLTFDANALVIVFAALVVVGGLTAFFRLTDVGIGVRAAAENADRARLLGVPVRRLSTVVWVLAGVLSALGVFLRIPVVGLPISADVGPYVLLYALAAAVLARMESFGVALAAGVAIGVTEQSLYYFSHDPSIASAIMLPVLLLAMLAQREKLSRGQDSGVATWRLSRQFRPIPPELAGIPEVAWGRFALGAAALAAAVALPYVVSLEQQILASVVVIYAVVAVSLVILTGWAGQISLGQWGLAGIGAFVTSELALHLHADFFLTLIAAGLGGAVVAIVIGVPALRIQGLYLAVTTLAFGIAVQVYVLSPNYFRSVLPSGLQILPRPRLYGHYSINGPRAYYYLCLVFLGLALASARGLRHSRAGRVMIAARDNERATQSYGVSVPVTRLSAFALSGFWAGVAGCLFAFHQQAVQPASFDPSVSILLLLIVVIGGASSLPGAVLGALFIGVLKYGGFSAQVQSLASGVGVLLLLYLVPGGLAQLFYDGRDRLLRVVAARRDIVVPSLVADVAPTRGSSGPSGAPQHRPQRVPILECRGVDVAYDGVQVLFGVDFDVADGEIVALLGTNGAGKSTLLRAISGLVAPQGGTVRFGGVDATRLGPVAATRLGIVQMPGGRSVFPTLTVNECLRLAGWLHRRRDPEHVRAATERVYESFPMLASRSNTLAGNLSGGEQQMLGVSMALLAKPRVLMIDELSLGLAPRIVAQLIDIVRSVRQEGTAVVLVEQSVNVALTIADRAVFMEKGEVRFTGATADLLDRSDILRSVFLEGAASAIGHPELGGNGRARRRSATSEDRRRGRPRRGRTVLMLEEVVVHYGGVRAVDGVSLELREGTVTGLIGPNGAGKTTLLDAITGFAAVDAGRVELLGHDITGLAAHQRARAGLGRSFQDARLVPSLTVAENIAIAFERHLAVRDPVAASLLLPVVSEQEAELDLAGRHLIRLLGLESFANKFVSELSTGTRRIVDLAMVLAQRPAVLLLDEPSSGIAQRETEALGPLLLRIRDETGCAMLVVEHDMPLISSISDTIVALELGEVIAQGTPHAVVNDPQVVASYLGTTDATIHRSSSPGATARR